MKTPDVLLPALRQYRGNDRDVFLAAFDYEETIELMTRMQKTIDAQARLIYSYREDCIPPQWALDTIEEAEKSGILR